MSFDSIVGGLSIIESHVSIPFEQGDVFRRPLMLKSLPEQDVSIPFEQGDVFRLLHQMKSMNSH